jgi:protein SCO1
MRIIEIICFVLAVVVLNSCDKAKSKEKLPILGRTEIKETDTVYHKIAHFQFVNQDSTVITPATFEDKVYVADFFFTSCPTICPVMKSQMMRIYEEFEENDKVAILSHTIDPEYDTVALLHDYADRLGVKSSKWHFVTGEKDEIYDIGQTSYMVTAMEDDEEPGGFLHSGAFILVDKEKRIRGIYDGTEDKSVTKLINDIHILLSEYND